MGNSNVLASLVLGGPAHAAGVEDEDLEREPVEQLHETVPLHLVKRREERVGPRNPQELSHLVLAAGGGPLGLAEHEIGGGLGAGEAGHRRDDILVPVQNEQRVQSADVVGVPEGAQVAQAEDGAAVLGIAIVVEVHRPVDLPLGHVFEVGRGPDDGGMNRRLVTGVETKGLGEAAVLGGDNAAVREQRGEVVLDGQGPVLHGEGGGGLPGAGEADDQHDPVAASRRDHLATSVEREPAQIVDLLVPHPQAALLGLAEVVGVHDPGDPGVQVHDDGPLIRIAGHRQVRRVDDGDLGLRRGALRGVVQHALHAGDVGVALLDNQSRGSNQGAMVADRAVDDQHLLVSDVVVLHVPQPAGLVLGDALRRIALGVVGCDVGVRRASSNRPGLHVVVAELGAPGVGHLGRKLLQLLSTRVVEGLLRFGDIARAFHGCHTQTPWNSVDRFYRRWQGLSIHRVQPFFTLSYRLIEHESASCVRRRSHPAMRRRTAPQATTWAANAGTPLAAASP